MSKKYKIGMIVAWNEGERSRQGRVIQVYPQERGVQVIPLDLEKPSYSIHIPTKEITKRGDRIEEVIDPVENVRVDTIATIQEYCKDEQVTQVSSGDNPDASRLTPNNPDVGEELSDGSSELTGPDKI